MRRITIVIFSMFMSNRPVEGKVKAAHQTFHPKESDHAMNGKKINKTHLPLLNRQ
jgi:hypothetical protein